MYGKIHYIGTTYTRYPLIAQQVNKALSDAIKRERRFPKKGTIPNPPRQRRGGYQQYR